ncbi:hypothetical protein HZB01_00535 [Candidatus Woesearchaeota archaeon]|nr:hypothetical protein [Candidatus Woesearchaeota archaeon]
MFSSKKGQPSGAMAGVLILLVGFIIILYILFLPPKDRADLLGEPYTDVANPYGTLNPDGSTPTYAPTGQTVFKESPGRLDYHSQNEFTHDVPSFNLFQTINSVVLTTENPFYTKNGWFDKKDKSFMFSIPDLEQTNNVMMTFENKKYQGTLVITLNGNVIYENDVEGYNVDPIKLPKNLLKESNEVQFSVGSVGGRFWTTNEYMVDNLKIFGEVMDISRQQSINTFFLEPAEAANLEKVTLKFYPDCVPSKVGKLNIFINRQLVFSGIPDCGIPNNKQFSPAYLQEGKNDLVFITEAGNYLVDRVQVQTKLTETRTKTYYFDLPYTIFTNANLAINEEKCGDIDGYCPPNCDEDIDKDCCFSGDNTAFWCDTPTTDEDDRCVNFMEEQKCLRCPSGYEDRINDPPQVCDKKCGDDTDNFCPPGCSANYDADCCYLNSSNKSTDYYFCYDTPVTGVDSTCQASVSYSECSTCVSSYLDEFGRQDPDCVGVGQAPSALVPLLKPEHRAYLEVQFADNAESKDAYVYINGHLVHIDTNRALFVSNIDTELQPGTNAVKIVPKSNLDIVRVEIKIN